MAASRSITAGTSHARSGFKLGSPAKGKRASGSPTGRSSEPKVATEVVANPALAEIPSSRPVPVPPPMLPSLVRGLTTPYGSGCASRTSSFGPARRMPSTTAPARHAPPIAISSPDGIPVPAPALTPSPDSNHVRMSYLDVAKASSAPTSPVSRVQYKGQGKGRAPPTPEVAPVVPEKGLAPSPADAARLAPSTAAPADGVSVGVRSVRDDMIDNVRFILEGLSFNDKCLVVGVEPRKAGYTVGTAASADGEIVAVDVPAGRTGPPGISSRKSAPRSGFISSNQVFVRALQAEKQEVANRVAQTVADNKILARSLSATDSPALPCVDPLSPVRNSSPPSPSGSPVYTADVNNPYYLLASPRPRQVVEPNLLKEAAHGRARKEDVMASFQEANTTQQTVEAAHLRSISDLEKGRAAEAQLGRELRDLGISRRKAEAHDREALQVLKAQETAERLALRERLEAHRTKEATTQARLARLIEDNAAKADAERDARRAAKAGAREAVRRREIREVASGSAVAAAEEAGRHILPKALRFYSNPLASCGEIGFL